MPQKSSKRYNYLGEYTSEEKTAILKYIIDNEDFFNLRGNTLWKNMEKAKVTSRTWQSMKEHFRRNIVNNLNCFNISKENTKKIIAGYNRTKTVYKSNGEKTRVPKNKYLAFSSDEEEKANEKERELSTSSDDSDNLVIEINKNVPSTSTEEIIKKKSTRKLIPDREESINDDPSTSIVGNQLNTKPKCINLENTTKCLTKPKEIETVNNKETVSTIPTTQINDSDQDDTLSISSNLSSDENFEDIKFLKTLTRNDSNLINCVNIVTFIKEYAANNSNIYRTWNELFNRFVTIINNLQSYDFLPREIVTKLLDLKEPLENRLNGFEYPRVEVIKLKYETLKLCLKPDPTVTYVNKEAFDLVSVLETNRIKKNIMINKFLKGEISEEIILDVIKRLNDFNMKYGPEKSIVNNNCDTVKK